MEADYRTLKAAWDGGSRVREDSLYLLFLAWMHWADPPFVTGLEDDPDAAHLWRTVFAHFGGEDAQDAEFLHVAALMARLFPLGLGNEAEWCSRAGRMDARSLRFNPEGFAPEFFEGRGEYGRYFAHQARAARGR